MTGEKWEIHIREGETGGFIWEVKNPAWRGSGKCMKIFDSAAAAEEAAFRFLEKLEVEKLGVTVMTFRLEKPDPARNPLAVFEDAGVPPEGA